MKLGAFSVSLAVKDLAVSKDFYEKLGFETFGGAEDQHYLIMKNGETLIGLFQGMFDSNNPDVQPWLGQQRQSCRGIYGCPRHPVPAENRGYRIDQ